MTETRNVILWTVFACALVVCAVMAFSHDPVMDGLGKRIVHERLVSRAYHRIERLDVRVTVHLDTHDPVLDWQRCLVCSNALSAAFATLADMDLGPDGSGRLVEVLRREAEKAVAHGAAS